MAYSIDVYDIIREGDEHNEMAFVLELKPSIWYVQGFVLRLTMLSLSLPLHSLLPDSSSSFGISLPLSLAVVILGAVHFQVDTFKYFARPHLFLYIYVWKFIIHGRESFDSTDREQWECVLNWDNVSSEHFGFHFYGRVLRLWRLRRRRCSNQKTNIKICTYFKLWACRSTRFRDRQPSLKNHS